jgi:short-subunit dehydrogenase
MITGASSGIGAAIALRYAEARHSLILTARNANSLEKTKQACVKHGAKEVLLLSLNLASKNSIEQAANCVLKWGVPQILINNAGISQRSFVLDTDLEVYEKLIQVDFLGTVDLTKRLLPGMLKHTFAQIAVTSSLTGKFGTPYRSGYAAAKHALHGFFESLRAEVDPEKLSITLLCPGFIHTQISVNSLTGDGSKLKKMDEAQASGMPPKILANKAFKAISKKQPEALIGGKEVFGVYLFRYWPNLFRRIIRKSKVR